MEARQAVHRGHDPAAAKTAVSLMNRVMRLGLIHEPGNDVFTAPVSELHDVTVQIYDFEGAFKLTARDQSIFINGHRIRQDVTNAQACDYMTQRMGDLEIGGFEMTRPPGQDELKHFLICLAKLPPPGETSDGPLHVSDALAEKELDSFSILDPLEDGAPKDRDKSRVIRITDIRERSITLYERTLDFLRQALTETGPGPTSIRSAKRLVHQFVDISSQQGGDFSLSSLAAIKNYDDYTYNHSVNVCVLSIAFGQKLGLPNKRLAELGVGALFHDLGKISIPRDVLNKSGTLTEHEWEQMRNHPLSAIRHLFGMHGYSESGLKKVLVAVEHHMNYDLSGYPKLMVMKKIHLYSRIVAIVDAFDAMTTQRVYQKAMRPDVVLKLMLEQSGKKYDPLLLKAFMMSVGLYPAGTLVLLNSGATAVVIRPSPNPQMLERPLVRVVGRLGHPAPVRTLDLGTQTGRPFWIVKSLDPDAFNVNVPHYLLYA
jgi:HD-GYP domain-containing protein (c-di-GMP phosphodiesterase class II)